MIWITIYGYIIFYISTIQGIQSIYDKYNNIDMSKDLLAAESYINPLPHALMLTAIVVSLGTTGVGLALLMKIKDLYGTIEEDEITGKRGKRS